jgi:hypothetical protein
VIAAGAVLAFLGLLPWVGPWWAAGIAGALTGRSAAPGTGVGVAGHRGWMVEPEVRPRSTLPPAGPGPHPIG